MFKSITSITYTSRWSREIQLLVVAVTCFFVVIYDALRYAFICVPVMRVNWITLYYTLYFGKGDTST